MPRSFELLYGGVAQMDDKEGIALMVMLLLYVGPRPWTILPRYCEPGARRRVGTSPLPMARASTAVSPARAQGLSATQPLQGKSASSNSSLPTRANYTRRETIPAEACPTAPPRSSRASRACPPRKAACPSQLKQDLPARITGHLPSSTQPARPHPARGRPPVQVRLWGRLVLRRTTLGKGTKTGHPRVSRAHDAVLAFAARLELGAGRCATGSELYELHGHARCQRMAQCSRKYIRQGDQKHRRG